jgi:hypothetical protein
MYNWVLKRKKQGRITAEIQNVDTTNAKLRRAGYYDGRPLSPIEICQTLGVDGVIISNYTLNKPMTEGQVVESVLLESAVRLHHLHGPSWPTYITSIEIHDFKTKKLIWSFDHTFVGVFSSPAHIVNVLLSDKSSKMPYIIK